MKNTANARSVLTYRPSATKVVQRWITGLCSQPVEVSTGLTSPSLHAYDRRVPIRQTRNAVEHWEIEDMVLAYSSQSYLHIESGQKYLFAVNNADCLGFLEVIEDDHLRLPDGTIEELDAFVTRHLNHPFPDYFCAFSKQ